MEAIFGNTEFIKMTELSGVCLANLGDVLRGYVLFGVMLGGLVFFSLALWSCCNLLRLCFIRKKHEHRLAAMLCLSISIGSIVYLVLYGYHRWNGRDIITGEIPKLITVGDYAGFSIVILCAFVFVMMFFWGICIPFVQKNKNKGD